MTLSDFPVDYLQLKEPYKKNTINIVAFVEEIDFGFGFFFLAKGTYSAFNNY